MKLLSRNPDKPKKQIETTIGKIIYGFLLFAPLLSILVTCMYITFNKNAFESYSSSEQITTFLPVQDSLTYNKKYYFDTDSLNLTTSADQVIYTYSNSTIVYNTNNVIKENQLQSFRLLRTNTNYVLLTYLDDNNIVQTQYADFNSNKQVTFTFEVGANLSIQSIYNDYIKEINSNVQNYLDNAFEYGTYKVENSNLYNWAKNTGTYDVLHNTTQLLGIENTFIPMLMAYWLLISVIYFIYDIALMLIMVVHRKIHELQESI